MSRKNSIFVLCFLAMFLSSTVYTKELAERKGFLLGIGPIVGGETNVIKKFGGGIGVRIGGAFNDRFQLYYEDSSLFTSKNCHFISLMTGMATFQAFMFDNAYAKTGIGFSVADVETTSNNYKEYWGWGADVGVGYEFRITKHFVMAPEIIFNYQRIDHENYYIPMGYLHLGWYF
jgi:hypothetical protein